jgi:DNA-binding LacI/PurR family transcriptional regulator
MYPVSPKGVAAFQGRNRNRDITVHLRGRIVSGEFAPGSRLPTRDDLELQLGASRVTIQKALDRLAQENFIQTEGRRGTFVVENPPHLARYALVFPHHPSDALGWGRFWTALSSEADALQRSQPFTFPTYYNVDGHTDSQDYQQLVRDLQSQRVAGLIFGTHPSLLQNTPLMDELGIPCVALTSPQKPAPMAAVYPDRVSFLNKAMAHFAARGRRKVALIIPCGFGNSAEIAAAIQQHGLTTQPYWTQRSNILTPETTRELTHLLMHKTQGERPDALLIADDNFVEHATGGLVQSGARVPQDVEVVAHCNFPWPTPSVLPVRRLGFDSREILITCLDSLDRQRRGESVPAYTQIPAMFEDKIEVPTEGF